MIALGGSIEQVCLLQWFLRSLQQDLVGLWLLTAIGLMVYFLMTSLGEMATYLPVTGSLQHTQEDLLILL